MRHIRDPGPFRAPPQPTGDGTPARSRALRAASGAAPAPTTQTVHLRGEAVLRVVRRDEEAAQFQRDQPVQGDPHLVGHQPRVPRAEPPGLHGRRDRADQWFEGVPAVLPVLVGEAEAARPRAAEHHPVQVVVVERVAPVGEAERGDVGDRIARRGDLAHALVQPREALADDRPDQVVHAAEVRVDRGGRGPHGRGEPTRRQGLRSFLGQNPRRLLDEACAETWVRLTWTHP
ncbi:hypothetical protein GA0115246_101615 [Streptomyces sp. SolWspMP-sol7th]|nr:hypothetical protein GA0115246_101615 [Streptomyces sp. SolWspMP-sol7th]